MAISADRVTSLSDHLASEASRADLVLTSGATNGSFNAARQISTGDFIMQVGRPVLLVAPVATPFRMEKIVIGWKNTREARRAIAVALPMLEKAVQVSLVEIAPEEELSAARMQLDEVAGWLGRHGIAADVHLRPATGDDAAELGDVADQLEAEIVVAGAYGHSRIREWALGGVTRTLLKHGVRSSFVSH